MTRSEGGLMIIVGLSVGLVINETKHYLRQPTVEIFEKNGEIRLVTSGNITIKNNLHCSRIDAKSFHCVKKDKLNEI